MHSPHNPEKFQSLPAARHRWIAGARPGLVVTALLAVLLSAVSLVSVSGVRAQSGPEAQPTIDVGTLYAAATASAAQQEQQQRQSAMQTAVAMQPAPPTATPRPAFTATSTPSWWPPGPQCYLEPGKAVLRLDVPYIHQVNDIGSADGNWACGPTSVAMVLAYYGKLEPWNAYISQEGGDAKAASSGSDYAAYVTNAYTSNDHTYSVQSRDPQGKKVSGLYGTIVPAGYADWSRIKQVLLWHGLSSKQIPVSFEGVKAALKRGHPVILGNTLTPEGHILVAIGYTSNNQLIVNDPYGNRFASGYGGNNGQGVYYSWSCARTRVALEVIGVYPPPATATPTAAPTFTPTPTDTPTITPSPTATETPVYMPTLSPAGIEAFDLPMGNIYFSVSPTPRPGRGAEYWLGSMFMGATAARSASSSGAERGDGILVVTEDVSRTIAMRREVIVRLLLLGLLSTVGSVYGLVAYRRLSGKGPPQRPLPAVSLRLPMRIRPRSVMSFVRVGVHHITPPTDV